MVGAVCLSLSLSVDPHESRMGLKLLVSSNLVLVIISSHRVVGMIWGSKVKGEGHVVRKLSGVDCALFSACLAHLQSLTSICS